MYKVCTLYCPHICTQAEQTKETDEKLESLIDEFSSTLEGLQESVGTLETR